MKRFDYSIQFTYWRESTKQVDTEVHPHYTNDNPLPVIAEEKREQWNLTYFCCINVHLFYKQRTVTDLEANIVTSDVLTTDI